MINGKGLDIHTIFASKGRSAFLHFHRYDYKINEDFIKIRNRIRWRFILNLKHSLIIIKNNGLLHGMLEQYYCLFHEQFWRWQWVYTVIWFSKKRRRQKEFEPKSIELIDNFCIRNWLHWDSTQNQAWMKTYQMSNPAIANK